MARAQTHPAEAAEQPISEKLAEVAATAEGESIRLDDFLDRMGARGFGVALLTLALPCCIPFLYVIPQIVAVPMLALAAQMAAGRRTPWLPERLRARRVPVARLEELVRRAGPALRFFERIARPRLSVLARPPLSRAVAVLLVVFCAAILTPLPGTNTAPGIAVAVVAIGLLERDGVLVGLGCVVGVLWVVLFGAAAIGLIGLLIG